MRTVSVILSLIFSAAKGIKSKAGLNLQGGTFIINSADDALHANTSLTIKSGIFRLQTGDDAIHADKSITLSPDSLFINSCYEGIESASITFASGFMSLAASDDGFNATMGSATESNDGSILKIEGGNILVNSTGGDGIDSNGDGVMTGGILIVHGPQSQPEVGMDVNGSFRISGGLLLVTGPNSGNMIEATSTSSTQYAVKITISSTLPSSSLFNIQDATGNNLVTYKPVRSVYYLVFSSPDLNAGSGYYIYTGGASTGALVNGIYTGGSYSGGTLRREFTITGKLTNVSF